MNDKIKITATLTKSDIEDILKDYFNKQGYHVVKFSTKLQEKGDSDGRGVVTAYTEFVGMDCELSQHKHLEPYPGL